MKIVLLDKDTLGNDIDLSIFKQFGEFITYDTTSPDKTIEHISDADIVLTNKVIIDRNVIDNTNVKLICITATGTNNVDLEYAKEKNIVVKNVAGYSTNSVAQITFKMLFRLLLDINYYDDYVKTGGWEKSSIFTNIDLPFNEIANKNWGIIGLGNIGLKVAEIATAFGANVQYYSTSNTNYNTQYNSISLDELIKSSDIISIHCPLNEKTANLFNYENMINLKDNAIIINVARGGIINEYDLVKVIKNKNLRIGIDTVKIEPIETNSPLKELFENKNIIFTPHIAWASKESRNKLIQLVAKNISDFIG